MRIGLCAIAASLALAGSASAAEPLTQFHLGANATVTTKLKVTAGKVYPMEVSGTRKFVDSRFPDDYELADAFWCFESTSKGRCPPRTQEPANSGSLYPQSGPNHLLPMQSFVDGPVPAYSPSHTYSFRYKPKETGTLVVSTQPQCGESGCTGEGFDIKIFPPEGEPDAGDVVTVANISRKVEVQRNESGWEPPVNGMKLSNGDRVHTGFKAGVTLNFPDGSRVHIGEFALVHIQDIGKGPEGGLKARLLLKTGEVTAQVNRSTGAAGDFHVKTPTTTASIRGTKFKVSYDGTATTVSVTESSVEVTANNGASVVVVAGQETRSTATSVSPPVPIGQGFKSGGLSSAQALARVTRRIAAGLRRCKLEVVSSRLTPVATGWNARLVIVRARQGIAGKPRGGARFSVAGTRVRETNALARRLRRGCR